MAEPLAVIVAPDLIAVDQQSVLNAALYFDVVYADCYSIPPHTDSEPLVIQRADGAVAISLESRFEEGTSFAPLREAQILLRPPGAENISYPEINLDDVLAEPLQQLLAESLREGAVFSAVDWTVRSILADRPAKRSRKSHAGNSPGGRIKIKLPATLDIDPRRGKDAAFRRALAMTFQLGTMLNTLQVSASCAATPLMDTRVNAELAHVVAKQFPEIAAAITRHRAQALPWKHTALAAMVLNDTLMNVRVRDAVDILHLRELLAPELGAFRAEMSRLAALLRSQPWEPSFAADAETLIATNVRPHLAALERRLANPSRRLLKHLVADWKAVSAASLLPFSACVLQGADVAWATLAGVCAGLGLGAIRTKLEEWAVREESALTFLIELRRNR